MRLVAASLLVGGALVLAESAHAQGPVGTAANRAVARACAGKAGQILTRERLADALVMEALPSLTLGEMATVAKALTEPGSSLPPGANALRGAITSIELGLTTPGSSEAKAITVEPELLPGERAGWLFDANYTLTCGPPASPPPVTFTRLQPIAVRGSVDALDDIGNERAAAPSAQLGWQEARVTNLDGETTRTETLTIDAAVGLAIGSVDRFALLYADYSRNRVETRTPDGESADDEKIDDVEALELGLLGTARIASLRTTGRIGITFDEVTNAQYLRGNLLLGPITGGRGNLGICNINSFRTLTTWLRGRCTFAAELELRDVLQRGTAEIGDTDTLAALGGTAGIEFGPGFDPDGNIGNGPVASARYTYLKMVEGALPDIDRFEASLSYRWWIGDVGFDFGLAYADGTERKSFADENRFGFKIGIIY